MFHYWCGCWYFYEYIYQLDSYNYENISYILWDVKFMICPNCGYDTVTRINGAVRDVYWCYNCKWCDFVK